MSFVINERDCPSGQAPTDRDVVPFVTETEEAVSIVVLVERVEGDATCPADPWYPVTMTLESPLGPRQLLDAHEFPPNQSGSSNSRTDESELLHLRPLPPSGLDKVERRFTCGRSIGGAREHRSITRSVCRVRPAQSGPIAVHDNLGGPVDGQKCDTEKGT